MSYKKLDIWTLAHQLAIEIHQLTLSDLPQFEKFEQRSQIRRSAKSISSNIVEGYGRRRYKQDFIRFLVYALASCDETTEHLEILFQTSSLKNRQIFDSLHTRLQILGRKINLFFQSVEKGHLTQNLPSRVEYPGSSIRKPESSIQDHV